MGGIKLRAGGGGGIAADGGENGTANDLGSSNSISSSMLRGEPVTDGAESCSEEGAG